MQNLNKQISEIKKLIKNDEFGEARINCEKLVKNNQAHVELNFLLSFIYKNLNLIKRAEEQLQITLYLDPNYYDALVELSFLYEKLGQTKKASNFRERAFRVANK